MAPLLLKQVQLQPYALFFEIAKSRHKSRQIPGRTFGNLGGGNVGAQPGYQNMSLNPRGPPLLLVRAREAFGTNGTVLVAVCAVRAVPVPVPVLCL